VERALKMAEEKKDQDRRSQPLLPLLQEQEIAAVSEVQNKECPGPEGGLVVQPGGRPKSSRSEAQKKINYKEEGSGAEEEEEEEEEEEKDGKGDGEKEQEGGENHDSGPAGSKESSGAADEEEEESDESSDQEDEHEYEWQRRRIKKDDIVVAVEVDENNNKAFFVATVTKLIPISYDDAGPSAEGDLEVHQYGGVSGGIHGKQQPWYTRAP
jgi:hypothetical protein